MSRKRLIDAWRSGHRKGYKLNEVKAELEAHGFVVVPTTKHWKATHADLAECPDFPGGRVNFSAHAFGKQGEIDPAAIKDFTRAIDWIEKQKQ